MTTTYESKTAAELKPGDAVLFLGVPRVITHFEERDGGIVWRVGGTAFAVFPGETVNVEDADCGPYDGYISETKGGYELALDGVVFGVIEDEAMAATALADVGRGRRCWKVDRNGRPTRLG